MTEIMQMYKCNVCSNVVEITHAAFGNLVCCNENMELLKENEAGEENAHFAHIENIDDIQKRVYFNHVNNEQHHIEYIEIISNDKKYIKRKFLKFDENPEITFKCECKEGFYVRLYCNLDGVWITK